MVRYLRTGGLAVAVVGCLILLAALALPAALASLQRVRLLHDLASGQPATSTPLVHSDPLFALPLLADAPTQAVESALREGMNGPRTQIAAVRLVDLLTREGRWNETLDVLRTVEPPLPGLYVRRIAQQRVAAAEANEQDRWMELVKSRYADPALEATVALAAGQFADVESILRETGGSADPVLDLDILARSLFYQEEFEKAAEIWKVLREKSPGYREFDYWYARARRYMGEGEEALQILAPLIESEGEAASPAHLLELALAYRDVGDCASGHAVAERGIAVAEAAGDSGFLSVLQQVRARLAQCASPTVTPP